MIVACHVWPGITPHPHGSPGSIWDIPVEDWLRFAAAADQWSADRAKGGI